MKVGTSTIGVAAEGGLRMAGSDSLSNFFVATSGILGGEGFLRCARTDCSTSPELLGAATG